MQIEHGDFLVSEVELSAVLNGSGQMPGALGLQPDPVDGQRGQDVYDSLDPSLRPEFDRAVTTLVAPAKVARFHYTIADESISRSFLAWAPGVDDELVVVVQTGDNRRVSLRSSSSTRVLISRLLAANEGLVDEGVSLFLSTSAILVFLAITEHLRLVRYHAMQAHTEPATIFNREEVQARLAEAGIEDFRWPLLFLDKVMPVSVATALDEHDVEAAIDELILAGLVDQVDESGELKLYEVAGPGLRISDALLHEIGKVALGISAFRADGEIGHEAMLLVRSGFDLFLFDLAGQQGAIASLGAGALEELMKGALQAPSKDPREATPAATPVSRSSAEPTSTGLRCPACGVTFAEGARFCTQCGTALVPVDAATAGKRATKTCPACGHVNRARFQYCVHCGAELTGE